MTSRSPEAGLSKGRIRLAAALIGIGATAGGCINPEDDFNDFLARPVSMPEASTPDVVLTPCEELLQQNPSGSYFLTCIVKLLNDKPFSLVAQVTTTDGDAGGTFGITFQPLKPTATSLADVVSTPDTVPPTPISSDCTFVQTIGNFNLPQEANTLGLNVVAENVVLRGKLQSATNACGDLDGTVISPPIGIDLSGNGDVCLFIRTAMDAPLPMLSAPADYICDPAQLPPPQ